VQSAGRRALLSLALAVTASTFTTGAIWALGFAEALPGAIAYRMPAESAEQPLPAMVEVRLAKPDVPPASTIVPQAPPAAPAVSDEVKPEPDPRRAIAALQLATGSDERVQGDHVIEGQSVPPSQPAALSRSRATVEIEWQRNRQWTATFFER